ncbi:MAG: phosphoribosylanthranilate isomerase [Methylococcaceae bacterium]|nr:phosphoribosylanthranilate isomerase [Methylococcaceae bacterium]
MRTRVKICGFTRCEDASAAARLGVDAIGLVFYPPSPRHVDIRQAQAIVQGLPPFVTVVGLFVDEEPWRIREILERVRIDLLQFHGDENPDGCAIFGRSYIKAVRMKAGVDLTKLASDYSTASGLLLDADDPQAKGGTGTGFDWAMIPPDCPLPVILAGGLKPANVGGALRQVGPYGLDVSSGVEAAKGVKDKDKMAAFIKEVQDFDHAKFD